MYIFWGIAVAYSIGVFWGIRISQGMSSIELIFGTIIVATLLFITAVGLDKHKRNKL